VDCPLVYSFPLGCIADDAARIKEFLDKHGLGKWAPKFKSWEHLMDSKREVLKHIMEIPCKDRKKIRAKVQEWKLAHYFTTGMIYQSSLPIKRTIVEDSSSSEDDLSVTIPTPQGLMQTYVHYPGATRREPHPVVENKSGEPFMTLLSDDEEEGPISNAASKRAEEFE